MNQDDFRKLLSTPRSSLSTTNVLGGAKPLKKVGNTTTIVPRTLQKSSKPRATPVLPFKKSLRDPEKPSRPSVVGIETLEDAHGVIQKLMSGGKSEDDKDNGYDARKDNVDEIKSKVDEKVLKKSSNLVKEGHRDILVKKTKDTTAQRLLKSISSIQNGYQVDSARRFNYGQAMIVFDLNIDVKTGKTKYFGDSPQFIERSEEDCNLVKRYTDYPNGSVATALNRMFNKEKQVESTRQIEVKEIEQEMDEESDEEDIFGDVGRSYKVSGKEAKLVNKEKITFSTSIGEEDEPDYISNVLGTSKDTLKHVKERENSVEEVLAKIETTEIYDANYMDEEDTKMAVISTVAFDDALSEEEEDLEFIKSLPKQQSDFKGVDEWNAYKESQIIRRNAGSLDINMSNYKVINKKDDYKQKAKKFGNDLVQIDNIMKRKYGESLSITGSKKSKK